jgi:hypothetical protein
MTRESEVAWLVIFAASLIASFCALALVSSARGPLLTLLAGVGVLVIFLFSSIPIYWLTYRSMPEGVIREIPTAQRHAAGLAELLSLLFYWLLGVRSAWARSKETRAAA